MSRLLSLSICLICTLAALVGAQGPDPINPCTTESYFFKGKTWWYLRLHEWGQTKVLQEGQTGPHIEFGPPVGTFMVHTATLDDYIKFVDDDHVLPFRYFAQLAGYCPVTDELRPIGKLVLEIASLGSERSICDSELVVARLRDDWRLTCRGCSSVRLEDVLAAPKAQALKKLAHTYADVDTLSFDVLLPNKCGEDK